MIATTERARPALAIGRIERDKIYSSLGLGCALLVSALLNLWNLSQNGYDNTYYSVAVKSMLQSFHNFFFVSYDAGGFISVDKPPVALWIQAISAKIFGFSSLSILMPEALAGIASVAIVYFLVRRVWGSLAAFVAAMAMAVTPIAVAVERGNNTDTWLMFFLLLAAWAMSFATEKGKLSLLLLGLGLVGVGFNTKMLAAFIVLPAFYLLYFVAAPIKWYKRVGHLALGTVVLLAVSLSWPLAVDLTPASQRPWVGGSQQNSVLDLALNYNGVGRVTGNEGNGFGGGGGGFRGGPRGNFAPRNGAPGAGGPGGPGGNFQPGAGSGTQNSTGGFTLPFGLGGTNNATTNGRGNFGGGGMFGAGTASPTRLFFGGQLAEQWSWLFPLALFGVLAALVTLPQRLPLNRRAQSLLLWAGWLAMYGIVFSMASGIFHPYYLIMLAPAAAALVGAGIASLWMAYRAGGWKSWLLPISLLATALWQINVLGSYPQWAAWLIPLTLGGTIVAIVPLVGMRFLDTKAWRRFSPGLLGTGIVALLISPLAWSITPVLAAPGNASLPEAGPAAVNSDAGWTQMTNGNQSGIVQFLEDNTQDYFYLVAVWNAQQASSLTLETGRPVLAAGGFMGSDPALTTAKLQQMIASKQVRYILGTGGRGGFGGGFSGGSSTSASSWIQSNCVAVDTSQYGGTGTVFGGGGMFGGGNSTLYDCAAVP